MLRKDTDVGRWGGCGEIVAIQFGMIRKWSEVLRRRMMWHGCTDNE